MNKEVNFQPPQRKQRDLKDFFRAFGFALDGVSFTLVCERNMKVHFVAATLVLLFELITRPPVLSVILTLMIAASVISGELINTVVERIVDHVAHGERLPFARIAKDAAAGAVLVQALAALAVATYAVSAALPLHWQPFSHHHLGSGLLSASGLLILGILTGRTYFFWLPRNGPRSRVCKGPQ